MELHQGGPLTRGVARNFMKMKPANRISQISDEAMHFLQYCVYAQRSPKESFDVWLISAKQWLINLRICAGWSE